MSDLLPVFNIERFSIHDGEGIRTTVFLQGCLLRCPWCANPESQTVGTKLLFLEQKCRGCGTCAAVCPNQCTEVHDGKARINRDICTTCGTCAGACPCGALETSGCRMDWEEVFQVVVRDKAYYQRTHGGMTLSGGEALLHAEALLPLLERCRQEGIGIAAETCGYVPEKNVETALPWVDTFLFDLKSLNPERFRSVTGGDLSRVLRNFERIAGENPDRIVVRVPVIPGFNSDEEEMRKIFSYTRRLGVKRLDLLPYHTLGISKYRQLGREYPYSETKALDKARVEPLATAAREEYGLQARLD